MRFYVVCTLIFLVLLTVACDGVAPDLAQPSLSPQTNTTPVSVETPTPALVEEAVTNPAETPTTDIIAEFDISNTQIFEQEGERLDETVNCFDRLFGQGRFVLFSDDTLTYTPIDETALADCLSLSTTQLKGDYEPADEADYAYELQELTEFADLDQIEIDTDGTFTQTDTGAIGTIRFRIFNDVGSDKSRIQMIKSNYGFNGAMAQAEPTTPTQPFTADKEVLADLLPDSFEPETIAFPEAIEGTLNQMLELYYVSQTPAADAIAFYRTAMTTRGWAVAYEANVLAGYLLTFSNAGQRIEIIVDEGEKTLIIMRFFMQNDDAEMMFALADQPVLPDAQPGQVLVNQRLQYSTSALPAAEIADHFLATLSENDWSALETDVDASGGTLHFMRPSPQGDDEAVVEFQDFGFGGVLITTISYALPQSLDLADFGFAYDISGLALNALDPVPNATPALEVEAITPMLPEASLQPVNPTEYSGDIRIMSSSTGFALAESIAIRFQDDGFADQITLANSGASSGVDQLCVGITDIALLRAAIDQATQQSCGRDDRLLEFVIGWSAVAVIINPANDWATDMTIEEVTAAFSTAETWVEVNPTWPAVPIARFSPASDSGVSRYFTSLVFNDDATWLSNTPNLTTSEDDNAIITGVATHEGGIGFLSHGVVLRQRSANVVMLNNARPNTTAYPLSTPLVMATFDTTLRDKPQVAAYLNYALIYGGEAILEMSFTPVDAETQWANEQLWREVIE